MQRKNYTLSSVIEQRELSGGEKTKLVLASLLYHLDIAAVILIDEVTASLDSESTQYFYHILKKYLADKLIIEITHETNYCDKPQYIEIIDKQLKYASTNHHLNTEKI